jgi:multidrug efflux pump subunit AcrB
MFKMGLLYLIFSVVAVSSIGLGLTKKGRYLIKGMSNLFFIDVAKTPKGAEAIYTQAITEASEAYNKSSNNLQKIAGLLNTAQRNLENTTDKIKTTEKRCEDYAKRGMRNEVMLYADELKGLKEDLNLYQSEVQKYTPMLNDAQVLLNNYEQKVKKLKKDKQTVVRQLEINQQTKEMYDDLDELKNAKTSDQLVSHVKEGLVESGEIATGAKILHESKTSTKLLQADSRAKDFENEEYVNNLMKKYSNK